MTKPSIAELLNASGHTTYTPELVQRAMFALYGHIGANLDERNWASVLQSGNPLEAAEAGLRTMYQSSAYLLRNVQHLEQSGYVAAQAEITYRQLADRLGFFHQSDWSAGTPYAGLGQLSMDQLIALVQPPPPPFTLTISATGQSPAFTEKAGADDQSGAVVINSGLTFSGNGTVTTATVTITNTQPGDQLLFTDTSKIQGVVTAVGGNAVLTLSAKPGQTPANGDFEAALESVRFNNNSDTPDLTARTIEFKVGNGTSTSSPATETVAVAATNDAPVFTLTVDAPVVEDAPATKVGLVVANYTATDTEGNAVVVAFTADSNLAGHYALNTVTLQVTLTATGATFVNGGGTLPAISLMATDDGAPSGFSIQTVTPMITQANDAPVMDALGASLAYLENGAASSIAPNTTVTDPDSANFDGGSLTVGLGGTGTGSDQLSVLNVGTGAGQIGLSGANVSYESTTIGTMTGGVNGADLVINLNSVATQEAVQALARAIAFANNSDNPSTSARSVSFTLIDGDGTAAGGKDTGSSAATVVVTSVNDAPVLASSAGNTAYTEVGGAVVVDGLLVLSDVDSDNLSSATAQITGNYQNGSDTLAFAGSGLTGDIAATLFDATTGTLTLTSAGGAATVAQWQEALRLVRFDSSSTSPGATRVIAFLVDDGDGGTSLSAVQTKTIDITEVNSAPTLAGGGAAAFVENAAAAVVDGALVVADPDTLLLAGATVSITTGFDPSQDVLAFTPIVSITGSYNATTGILSLSGSGTAAEYEQALRSVTYNNTSDAPSTAPRTIAFHVNDGQGVSNLSNATTVTLGVAATNDAPVVGGGGMLGYTEDGLATAISPLMTVADADSTNLAGGTLTVGFSANGTATDQLGILNQGTDAGQLGVDGTNVAFGGVSIGSFSGGVNGANLVVTLNSAATAAAVQALARAVTFSNTSVVPSIAPRTVTYTVVDGDGGSDTGSATATVNVTGVNDAPAIDAQAAVLVYTENAAAAVIAGTTTVSDVDSADFNGGSLTVAFVANGTAADQLAVRNEGAGAGQIGVSGANISLGGVLIGSVAGGSNGSNLVVSFNGAAATPAAVQALSRNITFGNTSDNPSTLARTVEFTVVDGGSQSATTTATINVAAVNDAPVVGGGGTLAYTENGAAAAISPGGTVSDLDATDFNGGSLTVGFTGNGTADDQLGIIGQGTGAGQIGISDADVTFGGANIGTVAGGANGSDLVVTFTASEATPTAVQALMQAIGFSNTSDAPSTAPRTVTYTVTDGGLQTGSTTATVNVTAVNDAPVTLVPANSSLGTAMSNVAFAVAGVSISDGDAGSSNVQTTVAVTNGTVAFSLVGGATVAAGANESASVTLQGTVAQVNAALSTFAFKGTNGLIAPTTAAVSVITSDLGNTGTGGTLQSNGGVVSTFQIGVIPQVFVIDNSTAVADDASAGTIANPFNTIASFNALASDGSNDVIYLKHGTGTYEEIGGFMLLAGQQLIGQGESLSFTNPVTNEVVTFGSGAVGTTPTVKLTGADSNAVTLAAGNTLKGLNLSTALGSQTALSDGNGTVGTLTVSNVDISGSGMAVDIDQGGVLNVTIDSLSSSGSTQQGVQLAAAGATLTGTFTAAAGLIEGAAGAGFLVGDGNGTANTGGTVAITYGGTIKASGSAAAVSIEDRVAGAGNVTLSGNITREGGNGTTINVDDIAAGTITLSGASSTLKSGTATGLNIADVSADAAVNLSGNLAIVTTSGTGIAITNNSGAVNFTGGQITVNTGSGSGVSITGGSGATSFNLTGNDLDIVTSAGSVGFNLANAGTVTVQGDDNTIQSTGGIGLSVTNSTIGAAGLKWVSINASNASSGIVLDNTGALGGLTVTGKVDTANSGGTISGATGSAAIVATNTQHLSLAGMKITNPSGHGILATNLRGINALTNSEISGFGSGLDNVEDGLRVVNNNVNMTSLTVTNTTFSNASGANDGIFLEAQGTSNMTLSVTNSHFSQFYGDAIQVNGITGSSGAVRVTVKESDFTNAAASGNGGISMNPFGNLSFFADIDKNTFSSVINNVATIGAIGVTNGGAANADITIRNNILDTIIGGRGITVTADGGTTDLLIDNNSIDKLGSTSKPAINVNYTNNAVLGTVGTGNVTISNNAIGQNGSLWTGGPGSANAILLQALNGASMTAAIQSNVVDANTNSVIEVVRVRTASTAAYSGGTINATVTGNTIKDTYDARVEFDATAGTSTLAGTVNLSLTGNTLSAGGVLQLTENTAGAINVTQASSAAVGSANSGATVTVTGSPTFGTSAPAQPTTPSLPLLALQGEGVGQNTGALALANLQALAEAAIARWVDAGIDAAQLALLQSVSFGVADLNGAVLGLSTTGLVLVDSNAAGWGWFVDATPTVDEEFSGAGPVAGQAGAQMDLLTVLMHELGHILGFADHYAGAGGSVMNGHLDIGQRQLPEVQLVGSLPVEMGAGA